MTEHFNQLSPAEAERLAMLSEEAGEIVQIVGKILRHGYDSYNPNDQLQVTNHANLQNELTDLMAVFHGMKLAGDLPTYMPREIDIERAWQRKLRYSHHQ